MIQMNLPRMPVANLRTFASILQCLPDSYRGDESKLDVGRIAG